MAHFFILWLDTCISPKNVVSAYPQAPRRAVYTAEVRKLTARGCCEAERVVGAAAPEQLTDESTPSLNLPVGSR